MTIARFVAERRTWSEAGLIQAASYSGHHHSEPPNDKRRPQLPHSRSIPVRGRVLAPFHPLENSVVPFENSGGLF
jgi:hypothetical protein